MKSFQRRRVFFVENRNIFKKMINRVALHGKQEIIQSTLAWFHFPFVQLSP